MNSSIRYALLAGLVLLPPGASAATASGAGAKTCGDFMEGVHRKSEAGIDSFVSWGQGFISGFNWANVKGSDVAVDPGALTYWLVNYCGSNPSAPFYEAMKQFIGENAR